MSIVFSVDSSTIGVSFIGSVLLNGRVKFDVLFNAVSRPFALFSLTTRPAILDASSYNALLSKIKSFSLLCSI